MPAPVESKLLQTPELAQVCVVGSGMPSAMALCTLSENARNHAMESLQETLHQALLAVNKSLEHHEQLSKLIVLAEEWTIQNGLLTPTLKIKRKMIDASFGEQYGSWSKTPDTIIFA